MFFECYLPEVEMKIMSCEDPGAAGGKSVVVKRSYCKLSHGIKSIILAGLLGKKLVMHSIRLTAKLWLVQYLL